LLVATLLVAANPLGLAAQPPAQSNPSPQSGLVIVLDPAHGGTDTGARGQGTTVEKDIVLEFGRAVRTELERQGFHVVMTRNDDSNPSYDDRATAANAHGDAIFITFHLSSTGTFGTARAYFYQFTNPFPPLTIPAYISAAAGNPAQATMPSSPPTPPLPPPSGLVSWDEAQRQFTEESHHLADILQGELSQRFPGSPATPAPAAVRGLRSVAAPAVAVEISSVAVSDATQLTALAAPLATSIVRSIVAFRPTGPAGAKQ
jgi:N-acetylmuramoyl-L-alanine amidase